MAPRTRKTCPFEQSPAKAGAPNSNNNIIAMPTQTRTLSLGNTNVIYTSELYAEEVGDTKVEVNGAYICSIPGSEISIFHGELEDIIERYRI